MIEDDQVVIKEKGKSTKPVVWNWKKAPMILNHSIRATVQEILAMSQSMDAININIIGNPTTGKSTLAETLGHLIHKLSKIPFAVRIFNKHNLLHFEETLANLTPANYVLVFDDVSFLKANASAQQIEMVKQAVTEIRHLPGGKDVKIISIKNFHYTLGLDKYLRQADFNYFTSVGQSEVENMEKIVGHKQMKLVYRLKRMQPRAAVTKKFSFTLDRQGKPFVYGYRDPFIPVLFLDSDSTLRFVVSPTRQWIDPICPVCTNGKGLQSEVPIPQFIKETEDKFSEPTVKTTVKQMLREQGIDTYSSAIVSCRRYMTKAMERKQITNEDLAVHYGLKPTNTKLRKKLDGVLS